MYMYMYTTYTCYVHLFFVGISDIRVSSIPARPLPNPRVVSNMLTVQFGVLDQPEAGLSRTNSMYTFQVGQFLDHDLTLSPSLDGKWKTYDYIPYII